MTSFDGDETPAWASDPDTLERIFHAALGDGDTIGVEHTLKLMALCDPRRAQQLLDDLGTALHLAAGGDVRIRIESVLTTRTGD